MGVLSLFSGSKVSVDTFEKELNQLYASISRKNQEISKLTRFRKTIIDGLYFYVAIGYVLLVSILAVKLPHNTFHVNWLRWFVVNQSKNSLLLLVGIPLSTYGLKIVIAYVIDRLIAARKKKVAVLKKKQKVKVEGLKELTNFNTTNDLLAKYDSSSKDLKEQQPQPQQTKQKNSPKNQQQKPQALNVSQAPQPPQQSVQQGQPPQIPRSSSPISGKKTIQDRIFDLLVGPDNDSIESRYALICKQCYGHCGLAPPGVKDPSSVKYICPYCKTFNGEDEDEAVFTRVEAPSQSKEITREATPKSTDTPEKGELPDLSSPSAPESPNPVSSPKLEQTAEQKPVKEGIEAEMNDLPEPNI